MCPIVTVKSLEVSVKDNIHVELDSHAGNSVVGSNYLVEHDHERYTDVYGYDRKSRHKIIITVDVAQMIIHSQGTRHFCLLIKPF